MDWSHYNIHFRGAKCPSFDENKVKMTVIIFMKYELFKPSCQSFTMSATNFIIQMKNINKFHADLKVVQSIYGKYWSPPFFFASFWPS